MIIEKIERIALWFASLFQKSIGIYREDEKIYICEQQNRLRKFADISCKTYNLNGSEYKQLLKTIASDFEFKDKFVCCNLRSPGAFFKILSIPLMPDEEIRSWLEENISQFVHSSITLKQATFAYRVVGRNENLHLLIGLTNRNEIEHLSDSFNEQQITVHALSYGLSDIFLLHPSKKDKMQYFYIISDNDHEFVASENGKLIYYNQIPLTLHQGKTDKNALLSQIIQLFKDDLKVLNLNPSMDGLNWIDLKSELGKNSCLKAKIIGHKAFQYTDDGLNFIIKKDTEKVKESIWKQAFLKLTITTGGLLLILYLLSYATNLFLGYLNEGINDQVLELAPQISQVEQIRIQKSNLLKNLSEADKMQSLRSRSFLLLEALAYHVPKDCWLTTIDYDVNSDKPMNVTITGMSLDRSAINEYLSNLEGDRNLNAVKLEMIQQIPVDKMYRDWKIRSSRYFGFQISIEFGGN